MGLTRWFDEFRQDLKTGLRQLQRSPGFTCVAVLLLALGIGANAAVFGVLKSVLLDSLPYANADQLVRISSGMGATPQTGPLSAGAVAELQARQRSFSATAAFDGGSTDVVADVGGGPRVAQASWTEPRFFEVLGVAPAVGRTFRDEEAISGLAPFSGGQLAPDTAAVTIVSDRAWRDLFAADPELVGKPVRVNGVARTVIGILPPGFVSPKGDIDFFFPMDLRPVAVHPTFGSRSSWLGMVARVKPDTGVDAAVADITAIGKNFAQRNPDDISRGINGVLLRDAMVGETRRPLLVLIASAALVLLMTCANLAAALLSRALGRRKEFAVRLALGAGRSRLVRQLLTESTLLAIVGGAAGLLVGALGLRLARTFAAPVLPAYADFTLDGGAILVTAAIALGTGVLFGAAPAMTAALRTVRGALQDESRGTSESPASRRLRGLLVSGQLALCVSLLVGAGLLTRSLWAMAVAPVGVRSAGVLSAGVQLPSSSYPTPPAIAAFQLRLVDRLRQLPGVERVAIASALPTADAMQLGVTVEGRLAPVDAPPFVRTTIVSDDYFRVLGMTLRAGRVFDTGERPAAAGGTQVAVITDSMARLYWPSGNAVGSRMRLGPNAAAPWTTVIGVVSDVRNDLTRPEAAPALFLSIRQVARPNVQLLLRASGDLDALTPSVARAVHELDPGLPLRAAMTLDAVIDRGLAPRRLPALLMGAFGVLALLLASVGVYAMFANMTTSREREFGVRLALGSRPSQIAGLVIRQGAIWIIAGLAAGVIGIVLVARLVGNLLYGIAPFDPLTLGGSVLILIVCALLALLIPLRRATRVDPASALRA